MMVACVLHRGPWGGCRWQHGAQAAVQELASVCKILGAGCHVWALGQLPGAPVFTRRLHNGLWVGRRGGWPGFPGGQFSGCGPEDWRGWCGAAQAEMARGQDLFAQARK
eukprot:4721015-Lingulodinium_polyedra.AAC.1